MAICRFLRMTNRTRDVIDYSITERPKLKIDSGQVTISDVKIDFTGKTLNDLPVKYQEVQVIRQTDTNQVIELIGYVEKHALPTFKTGNETKILTLKLMTPQVFISKRTISAKFTDSSLEEVLTGIMQPAIEDGFNVDFTGIQDLDVVVSNNYIKQPLEKLLNDMAKQYSFMWYGDTLKNIYFVSLNTLQDKEISYTIDNIDCEYLETMTPFIVSSDYANIVNIKNIKLISTDEYTADTPFTISENETYNFPYSFWSSEVGVNKSNAPLIFPTSTYIFYIQSPTDIWEIIYYTKDDVGGERIEFSSNLGVDGIDNEDPTKTGLLIKDPFISNVYSGIKFTSDITFNAVFSSTYLYPFQFSFYDTEEIVANREYTNTSGKIEKNLNANNRFMGREEVFEYARGNLVEVNNEIGEIELTFQNEETEEFLEFIDQFSISDKINVNLPDLFVDGTYIVTSIEQTFKRGLTQLKLYCKNLTLNETFLDIYRKEDTQEDESQLVINGVGVYFQDTKIIEKQNIIVNGVVVNED